MLPRSDTAAPMEPGGVESVDYDDADVWRMLAEVERRSGRRRKRQVRAAQMAACLAIVLVAWLTQTPTANGEVRSGYQPAAASITYVGLATPSRV